MIPGITHNYVKREWCCEVKKENSIGRGGGLVEEGGGGLGEDRGRIGGGGGGGGDKQM